MYYIGIDLGTTNIKAALYRGDMTRADLRSLPVEYFRDGIFVEFDAEDYFRRLCSLVNGMLKDRAIDPAEVRVITLTGQAETLIVLGRDGKPLRRAISWMDERSTEECAFLQERFTPEEIESVTGQMAVLPTWPATKILWLRRHEPETYASAAHYVLLKDYIVYRLTGRLESDMSIATFSFYFDIYQKCYWRKMTETVGIRPEQLPPLAEPLTEAGPLTAEAASLLGLTRATRINRGTLDHFAGMIGTGNTAPGQLTLSTGTVMALSAMTAEPCPRDSGIAMHYGFLPDTHIMLPVAESGGVSLEWFRQNCLSGMDYGRLNEELSRRSLPNRLIFLPFLVGTNAPDFDADASGLFYGLRAENDSVDMAAAVMEGVSFLLRKNCEAIRKSGTGVSRIIATGGGSKSALWCQMQADITGLPVVVPAEKEAACLGAALAGAVGDGLFPDLASGAASCVSFAGCFTPHPTEALDRKYRQYQLLYDAMLRAARL